MNIYSTQHLISLKIFILLERKKKMQKQSQKYINDDFNEHIVYATLISLMHQ
jgi:hypothetical protein